MNTIEMSPLIFSKLLSFRQESNQLIRKHADYSWVGISPPAT